MWNNAWKDDSPTVIPAWWDEDTRKFGFLLANGLTEAQLKTKLALLSMGSRVL
jgi:hypothetical protein